MSNVQEALKSIDIEKLLCDADLPLPSPYDAAYFHEYLARYKKFAESYHAALSEIEKCEPVAEIIGASNDGSIHTLDWDYEDIKKLPIGTKLYTSPQPIDWVGLTCKQKVDLREENDWYNFPNDLIEATEAKCKQLNTKG